jgi:ABC-2 type transport system permease protein
MKIIFGLFSGYLLFLFVVIYGSMIMRSVIEEKTSRIIEVIISSVKPIQLMMGKIVGTSLVAISQYTVWVILIFILSTLSLMFMGIDMEQVTSQQQVIQNSANSAALGEVQLILSEFFALPLFNLLFTFLLYFIFGFLLYSSLYAAIGAAVDNETDSQQFMLPVLIPLMIAMYVGAFTVIEDPHGTVSTVFSHIPFTSPVVMLMRIPFGVPVWEQCLSILILICTFMGTVWVASKIYRVGILMYGKKPSYKELYKWLKY